jgi:ribosome-binding protein aMBF1 (putative translation factor)
MNTEGRRLLVAALREPGRSQSWLARETKIAQSSVGLWVHGKSRPEPHLREALEILLGIPREAWDTARERAHVARIRAAHAPSEAATGTEG